MREPTDAPQPAGSGQAGRDRIAAVVRGPGAVFLYWELNGPRSAEAVQALGADCRWCLRVLNLTDGSSTTVPVDPTARNHYLEVPPGSTCGFELAATDGERWRSVCRTERVAIPPAEPPSANRRQGAGTAPAAGQGAGRPRRALTIEVAGLRFETTAVHLGSSRGRPPAEAEARKEPEPD
jgi:hypothetical protein